MTEKTPEPAPVVSTGPGPGTVMHEDPTKATVKPSEGGAGPGAGTVMFADPTKAPKGAEASAATGKLINENGAPFHADPNGMPVEKAMKGAWTADRRKVELKILLAAAPAKVFHAVSDSDGLVKWFCRTAAVEPREGGRFAVGFKPGKTADWKITVFKKDQALTVARPETVSFVLKAEGPKTLLQLTAELPEDLEHSASEQMLWSSHLLYLKAWLEHGVELREGDEARAWKDGYVNGVEPA